MYRMEDTVRTIYNMKDTVRTTFRIEASGTQLYCVVRTTYILVVAISECAI